MSKYSSSKAKILLVDGISLLGAKPKALTSKVTNVVQSNTHGLGDDWFEASTTGMRKGEVTQSGAFFDDSSAGMHATLSGMSQVSRLLVYGLLGNTIGKAFTGVQGIYQGTYEVLTKVNELSLANATYVVSGQVDRGIIVQDWTAKTVDWNTKTDGTTVDYTLDPENIPIPITSATKASPAVVTTTVPHRLVTGQIILTSGNSLAGPSINSEQAVTVLTPTTFSVAVNTTASSGAGTGGSFVLSSTVTGGVGYQMVSAFSGFTGFVGKLRHSDDDITYVDLITFANVTAAPAAERLTAAGTIKRFLSYNGDVTGSGSITPFAGFKRNAP